MSRSSIRERLVFELSKLANPFRQKGQKQLRAKSSFKRFLLKLQFTKFFESLYQIAYTAKILYSIPIASQASQQPSCYCSKNSNVVLDYYYVVSGESQVENAKEEQSQGQCQHIEKQTICSFCPEILKKKKSCNMSSAKQNMAPNCPNGSILALFRPFYSLYCPPASSIFHPDFLPPILTLFQPAK